MMKKLRLRSPRHEDASIELPEEASRLSRPFNAMLCSPKGDEYPVTANIVRLDHGIEYNRTPAQLTNFVKATAANYEDVWRTRALGYFTGEAFPFEREKELLLEWTQPKPDELVLDAACSTALYGRFLMEKEPGIQLYAVDFSPYMLEEARSRLSGSRMQAYLLCANVEALPFWAGSFDLIVCGGSLNEFGDPVKALYELRRVLVPGGRAFFMFLTEATGFGGKLLQKAAAAGGLQFFSMPAARQLFERCGFRVAQAQQVGLVGFTLLEAV
jgi:SAM-dependent methyltransferase